jgi:hypothetical protein
MTSTLFRILVAAVAWLTIAAFGRIAPANAATTAIVRYSASSMRVTGHAQGYCWTSSIASNRSDAYRCMVENAIYDPCFTRNASSLVCPQNLVQNTGLALKLTKPLPPAASPQAAQPWAMVLAARKTCNRGTGTIDPDYPFYCEGIHGACSAPDRSKNEAAYFVTCSSTSEGKPRSLSHWTVTAIYQ